jgi:hypothetical protein
MTVLRRRLYKKLLKQKIARSVNEIWPSKARHLASADGTSDYAASPTSVPGPNVEQFEKECYRQLLSLDCGLDNVTKAVTIIVASLPSTTWRSEQETGTPWLSLGYETHFIKYEEYEGPDLDHFRVAHQSIREKLFAASILKANP